MEKLKWGLLAAGGIAKAFAGGLDQTGRGTPVAVASRSKEKAEAFAKEFGIPTAYGSYDDLLADPDVEAVYVSTPHPLHACWAIRAAEAGKHVLCEKPVTLNHADAMTVIEAARRNDVFFMEAFMYRCNPQTIRLVELIREGAIGEVRTIEGAFSFHAGYNLDGRLLNAELGGGGILDVGCYTVSMARLLAGAALGRDFAEPVDVQGAAHVGSRSGVDEWAVGTLRFEGDILAQVACGVQLARDNALRVFGSEGNIVVRSPWVCNGRQAGELTITLNKRGAEPEEVTIAVDKGIYGIEAEHVAHNLAARQSPVMSWDDTLGNMATLDRWRGAVGLAYPGEEAAAYAQTLSGRRLAVRPGSAMPYGSLPGLDKKISRLVMGMDNQTTIAHSTAMYDDFFERGGNTFDTAYIYGGGLQEKLFGQWVRNRGIRDEVVLLDKGAHTPHCNPEALLRQFDESLERLQMDHMDLYIMHRDNPEIPVGEFIDVLNDLKDAGRVRAFGGSNWTVERYDEANAWAAAHGKTGLAAVSNNFSLARMVSPVWGGCLAASEPAYKAWHERTQTPLFAWSSQARGFFVPERAHPDKRDDEMLVRCWYSEDNFKRQARCFELAEKLKVAPIAVALAYVLNQPFPTFALIGPRCISETVGSCAALGLALSTDEVKWLNLED